jgi:DNA-binding protein H-NS
VAKLADDETIAELEAAALEKARELEEIQRKLEAAQASRLEDLVERLRLEILESGFDHDRVLSELGRTLKKRRMRLTTSAKKHWRMKDDHGCVYSGQGQLPRCVLRSMRESGLDPRSREDRQRFFIDHMERCDI